MQPDTNRKTITVNDVVPADDVPTSPTSNPVIVSNAPVVADPMFDKVEPAAEPVSLPTEDTAPIEAEEAKGEEAKVDLDTAPVADVPVPDAPTQQPVMTLLEDPTPSPEPYEQTPTTPQVVASETTPPTVTSEPAPAAPEVQPVVVSSTPVEQKADQSDSAPQTVHDKAIDELVSPSTTPPNYVPRSNASSKNGNIKKYAVIGIVVVIVILIVFLILAVF